MDQFPIEQHIIDVLTEYVDKSFTIRLIEDNKPWNEILKDILQSVFPKATITITTPETWLSIEQEIREQQFDMVFVDVNLNNFFEHPNYGTNGLTVIPFIKKESPNTCIIALSSNPKLNDIAVKDGANFGIVKKDIICLPKQIGMKK